MNEEHPPTSPIASTLTRLDTLRERIEALAGAVHHRVGLVGPWTVNDRSDVSAETQGAHAPGRVSAETRGPAPRKDVSAETRGPSPPEDETPAAPARTEASSETTTARAELFLPADPPRTVRLAAQVSVPAGLAGVPLLLLIETDAEALLRVDGEARQGIDGQHGVATLAAAVQPGDRFALELELWTGRLGGRRRLSAWLATRDDTLHTFVVEARTLLGLACALDPGHPATPQLAGAVEAALGEIDEASGSAPSVPTVAAAREHGARLLADIRRRHPPEDAIVHLVGNSHIDVTWLWTVPETRGKMARTTATVLALMAEHPDFRFVQSQPQLYAWLEEDESELFRRVVERVADGRWEPVGAMWVEPDCNIPSGESLVRQILHGQRYWRERFGRESDVLWLPDTFGYAWALPQILAKSGVRRFMTMKLTWNDTNVFPHGHFEWEGPDGSRVRCTLPQALGTPVGPEEIARAWEAYPSKDVVPALLYLYGHGDGGGGPVAEDVEAARRLGDSPAFPRCRLSSAREALEQIAREADRRAAGSGSAVPVWREELYLELHRGTLTTHARLKRDNRRAEQALREAEIRASLASILTGAPYPAGELRAAWEKVLLNQFHDIVPGSSIPEVYPAAHARYAEAIGTGQRVAEEAARAVVGGSGGSEASTGGSGAFAFVVLSNVGWPLTQWVEARVPLRDPVEIRDAAGRPVIHQVLSSDDDGLLIGLEAALPALGGAAFVAREVEAATGVAPASGTEGAAEGAGPLVAGNGPAPEPAAGAASASRSTLENGRFRLVLDERGRIASLRDLVLDRDWLDGPGNQLQTFADEPSRWEAWDIEASYMDRPVDLLAFEGAEAVESGPLRAVLRLRYGSVAGSRIEQDVVVYRSIPRIDFVTRVDWRERRTLLKCAFPAAARAPRATYEIQFAAIQRPTTREDSWEAARFEVAGHRWIDLSDEGGGLSLLNDGRYGHDVAGNVLRTTLLRNAASPDPRDPSRPWASDEREPGWTDDGEHVFRYALLPHAGDWRTGTPPEAHAFNAPPTVVGGVGPARPDTAGPTEGGRYASVRGGPPPPTTPAHALLAGWRIKPAALVVETLKAADDGDGWILRVWEGHGGRWAARVELPFSVESAEAADLMERPWDPDAPAACPIESPVTLEGGRALSFELLPWQVRTFRLRGTSPVSSSALPGQ